MNEADYSLLKIRLTETMTTTQARRVDGADMYAENGRYGYLISKDRLSYQDAIADRTINESSQQIVRQLTPLDPLPVSQPPQGGVVQ